MRRQRTRPNNGRGLQGLATRGARKRRTWTFERLEERCYFSLTPLAVSIPLQSLSNSTPEGAQQLLDREMAWDVLQAGGADAANQTYSAGSLALPNDPYLMYFENDDPNRPRGQWHLINTGQLVGSASGVYQDIFGTPGEDINVSGAWDLGFTGKGVTVAVVDSGVQSLHPDISANYNPNLSFNILGGTAGGGPGGTTAGDAHGTAVAGLIAAVGDNDIGMTGVAYNATLASLRLLSGAAATTPLTDLQIAQAFSRNNGLIDIYNHSWGPSSPATNPRQVEALGPLSATALRLSATQGRNGLGNIHVVAAGNDAGPAFSPGFGLIGNRNSGGSVQMVNSRFTIAVSAVDHDGSFNNIDGSVTNYAMGGTAILVAAPSGSNPINLGDNPNAGSGIWTLDLLGDAGANRSPVGDIEIDGDYFPDTDYQSRFNGTSAAAPSVSGVIALMLEANPNLTYRDVEEILVRSARQNSPFEEPTTGGGFTNVNGWITNVEPFFRDPNVFGTGSGPVQEVYDPVNEIGYPNDLVPTAGIVFEDLYKPPATFQFVNGAGYTVHQGRGPYGEEYGYGHGVIDAELAVQLALQWHERGQNVLPNTELQYSTFVEQLEWTIRGAQKGNMDSGSIIVPGAVVSGSNGGFIDYWNEYFADDPFSGDDPPVNNRGGFIPIAVPDTNLMSVEWVEVKLSLSGDDNALDFLRISLVSPNGTVSDLTNYEQPQGSLLPGSFQYPSRTGFLYDPPGTLVPEDGEFGDQFVWTYTTNRDWGERSDSSIMYDPLTGTPLINDFGEATERGWELHFENWSGQDIGLDAFEVNFYGKPLEQGTRRVQGNIGIDAGAYDQTTQTVVGAMDGDFNFNRYITTGLNSTGLLEETLDRTLDPLQEPFASNVVVSANRSNGDGTYTKVAEFITGADGNYYFDLPPDDYLIKIESDPLAREQLDDASATVTHLPHYASEWHITEDWFDAWDRDIPVQPGLPGEVLVDLTTGIPLPFLVAGDVVPDDIRNLNFLLTPNDPPADEITITGIVYADLDANGAMDGADSGIGGVVVYWDSNNTGAFEPSDPSVTTNADPDNPDLLIGEYSITIPTAAQSRLSVGARAPSVNWVPISPGSALRSVLAEPGDEFTNVDFGFFPVADAGGTGNQPGQIIGSVFHDRNGDGVQDPGEEGLPGFRVFIDANGNGVWDDDVGNEEQFTISQSTGGYSFNDLPPNTLYRIDIEVNAPYQYISPAVGYIEVQLLGGTTATGKKFGVKSLATRDFGDLGAPYPTLESENGPRHEIVDGFHLGSLVDGDFINSPLGANADWDDTHLFDDEDGVVVLDQFGQAGGNLQPGENKLRITVAGVGGLLNAWMDFNNDGDWDDVVDGVSEQIFTDLHLNPGTHTLTVTAPASMVVGPGIASRFRWGEAGLSYTGPSLLGEVEDYRLPTVSVQQQVLLGDFDLNGYVDEDDFLFWRQNYGAHVSPGSGADGNGDGVVDSADYGIWRDHMGEGTPPGAGGGAGAGSSAPAASSTPSAAVYPVQALNRGPTPEAAAYLESIGAVPITVRVGLNGTQTLYYFPWETTIGTPDAANPSTTGTAPQPVSIPTPAAGTPVAETPSVALRSFSYSTHVDSRIPAHVAYRLSRPLTTASGAANLHVLDRALAEIAPVSGEQDDDDDTFSLFPDEKNESVCDLALVAVMDEEESWRPSI